MPTHKRIRTYSVIVLIVAARIPSVLHEVEPHKHGAERRAHDAKGDESALSVLGLDVPVAGDRHVCDGRGNCRSCVLGRREGG